MLKRSGKRKNGASESMRKNLGSEKPEGGEALAADGRGGTNAGAATNDDREDYSDSSDDSDESGDESDNSMSSVSSMSSDSSSDA